MQLLIGKSFGSVRPFRISLSKNSIGRMHSPNRPLAEHPQRESQVFSSCSGRKESRGPETSEAPNRRNTGRQRDATDDEQSTPPDATSKGQLPAVRTTYANGPADVGEPARARVPMFALHHSTMTTMILGVPRQDFSR